VGAGAATAHARGLSSGAGCQGEPIPPAPPESGYARAIRPACRPGMKQSGLRATLATSTEAATPTRSHGSLGRESVATAYGPQRSPADSRSCRARIPR
jgi:hypothetical protein